jgi:hypothetical protein
MWSVRQSSHALALPQDWEEWVRSQGRGAGFCQSAIWARVVSTALSRKAEIVTFERDGARRAGALLYVLESGADEGSLARRLLARLRRRTFVCHEGPILAQEDRAAALAGVLDRVEALRERLGGGVQFTSPPAGALLDWDPALERVFERFGYRQSRWATAFIDLARSDEELLKSFRHAARKCIHRCEELAVRVEECLDIASFEQDFVLPYRESKAAGRSGARMLKRDLAMWEHGRIDAYRFFVAKDADGRVLATLGTYRFNGIATEIMSGRTALSERLKCPAQDFLHWEVMRGHRDAGERLFNMAGFNPSPGTPREEGIRRFKEKWGGTAVAIPQFFKEAAG